MSDEWVDPVGDIRRAVERAPGDHDRLLEASLEPVWVPSEIEGYEQAALPLEEDDD